MEPTATTPQPATNKPASGKFWPGWLGFHFLLWIAAWVVAFIVGGIAVALLTELLGMFIASGVFGAIVSLAAWVGLRTCLPNATYWLLASFLGWGIGVVVPFISMTAVWSEFMPFSAFSVYLYLLVISVFSGAIIGVAQWLVLRQHTSRASRWMIGTIAAMLALAVFNIFAFSAFGPTYTAGPNATDLEEVVVGLANFFEGLQIIGIIIGLDVLLGGLIYGAVTGFAARGLQPHAQPAAAEQPQSAPDTPALT